MYLVDTDVLSRVRQGGTAADDLKNWMDAFSDLLFLSWITVAEVERGIVKAERIGAASKAQALRGWKSTLQQLYQPRILPFDELVADTTGKFLDEARSFNPGFADMAIAATAAAHGLTLLSGNVRHFAPLGIKLHDPFLSLPEMN